MDSVVRNGWDQLRCFVLFLFYATVQHLDFGCSDSPNTTLLRSRSVRVISCTFYGLPIVLTAAYHLALLYYDYALTFGREFNLFWSLKSFKRWGSILFLLNRYCGVIGHAPIFVEIFTRPGSALCGHLHLYHQFLGIVMQSIVAGMSLCSPVYHIFGRISLTTKKEPS